MPEEIHLATWPRCMKAEIAAAYLGISISLLHAGSRAGRYPKPFHISVGRVVWLKEELDALIDRTAGRPKSGADASGDPDPAAEWDTALGGDAAT